MKILLAALLILSPVGAEEMDHAQHSDHNHQEEQSEVTQYTCPMHPQIIKDAPGQCPICGMDLVPVKKASGTEKRSDSHPKGHATVEISPERQQLIGVKTTRATRKNLFKEVKAPGQVAFDPELYTAQSEYLEAIKQLQRVKDSPLGSVKKNVQRMVESARIRLRVLGLSEDQINSIRPGSTLSEGLLLSQKKGKIWIYAEVFEVDLRNIAKGQSVKISSNFLEGKTIAGTVVSTDEVINPKTRTAKVRIQIPDPEIRLRSQSYVNVNILVPQGEHLAIPHDAVIDTGEDTHVFLRHEDGRLEPRKIEILFQTDDEVAVASGLAEGDTIVSSANFLVDSESRLKGVLEQFASGHQH